MGLRLRLQRIQQGADFVRRQLTIRQSGKLRVQCRRGFSHIRHTSYQRLPVCLSNRGFTLADMASRARNIRERTVPIGQAMVKAISS